MFCLTVVLVSLFFSSGICNYSEENSVDSIEDPFEYLNKYAADSSDPSNLVIHLKRQTPPWEQHLNSKNFGVNFDWMEKKHHYTDKRTNDSIALYRFLDNEFYGEIVVGHPGQKLYAAFATTWEETWVLSVKCDTLKKVGCWFHNTYDHTKSSEYHKDGRPFFQNEGTYNLTGIYSYENISFAHSNVTNQSFVEMENVGPSFFLSKADGVLGLSRKYGDYDPFFYTLLKQDKIKNPVFSIYLNRDRQSKNGGNIMLGFMDWKHVHITNKKYDPITVLPVDPNTIYWQFTVDRIIIDDHKQPITLCQAGCKAVPDSSSNVIMGPQKDIDKIHEMIKAEPIMFGYYAVNCDTYNKLPVLNFVLGGRNFTLKGPQYVMKVSYRFITICVSVFRRPEVDFEQNIWYLGGAFLSEYYSIYDTGKQIVSFVKAA